MQFRFLMMTMCAAAAVAPATSQASVFAHGSQWPTSSSGTTQVRVCVRDDSSAEQTTGGAIHADNPGLQEVVRHVREALYDGWERHTNVRFFDWRMCSELTTAEKDLAMHMYIHPSAANESHIGTGSRKHGLGPQFQPWGRDADCIEYDWGDARMEYSFECVEQYAIHEFGHALGLLHEWRHPNTPAECDSHRNEPPCSWTGSTWADCPGTVYVHSATYDPDSIMVYDSECADVDGRRFGSTRPTDTDIDAMQRYYPPVASGPRDVGVLAPAQGCSVGDSVTVYMDDEDDDNESTSSGWTGKSGTHGGRNTQLEFCRVDGDQFRPLGGGTANSYGVLKLGPSCPVGSREAVRYYDNEDDNNENHWIGPGAVQDRNTWLTLCVFAPSYGSDRMSRFPDVGMAEYGVFAKAGNMAQYGANGGGWVYSDDEDDDNENSLTGSAAGAAAVFIDADRNTRLHISRIQQQADIAFADGFGVLDTHRWQVHNDAGAGAWQEYGAYLLYQTSNAGGQAADGRWLGTSVQTRAPVDAQHIRTRVWSNDNDILGIMFGIAGSDDFYRAEINTQGGSARIVEVDGGAQTDLTSWSKPGAAFPIGRYFELSVDIVDTPWGAYAVLAVDGEDMAVGTLDHSFATGRIGLFTAYNAHTWFDWIEATHTAAPLPGLVDAWFSDVSVVQSFLWNGQQYSYELFAVYGNTTSVISGSQLWAGDTLSFDLTLAGPDANLLADKQVTVFLGTRTFAEIGGITADRTLFAEGTVGPAGNGLWDAPSADTEMTVVLWASDGTELDVLGLDPVIGIGAQ